MDSIFWSSLANPVIGLSPMDGVTDAAMRFVTASIAKPSIMFTEFTSAEGIRAGASRLMKDFMYSELERPVIAQIFGSDPDAFYLSSLVVCALGFDGIDINMGCPAKSVAERGCGAGLINTPKLAAQIIASVKQGIVDYNSGIKLEETPLPIEITAHTRQFSYQPKIIPVSVKTRIGYDQPQTRDWIGFLLEQNLAAISLHGRTLRQHYTGFADWDQIALAAELARSASTVLLGNGDIKSHAQATNYIKQYQLDGVLIGRAALGNPWVFSGHTPSPREKLDTAVFHAQTYEQMFPGQSFLPVRKHLSWYAHGFPGAANIRIQLVQANSAAEVTQICQAVV